MSEAPKGRAVLVKSRLGTVAIAEFRSWGHAGKELEAWWVVASKPYFCPLQIMVVNPRGWQEVPE